MAIYHLEAKVISRGAGRSAVAAAAYMSCSQIYNDYDGIQHDYTRKQGLIWQQVFLPPMAPTEWQDRAILWNAVEENEKTKDSRLAREFVVALPLELSSEQHKQLLTDFIQEQFVTAGMCADVAIHDTDGHNPHAHIMLTVRPLDEKGQWQYKTEKEYLCIKDGEERGFTAAEFKAAQSEGWEKQYQYKVGKKKVYMSPSTAKAQGYERISKYPKSTKYGRQNPISERWNSDEQLVLWREAWATTSNHYLELVGSTERIDHRSHAERGLDEQPTVHEGYVARNLEKQGIIADRCELNRQIKADNKLVQELKSVLQKLSKAAEYSVTHIAQTLETIRDKIILAEYQLLFNIRRTNEYQDAANELKPILAEIKTASRQIKEKVAERKAAKAEQKACGITHPVRSYQLSGQITTLTEEIEELKEQKSMLMSSIFCNGETEIKEQSKRLKNIDQALAKLDEQRGRLTVMRDEGIAEFETTRAEIRSEDNPAVLKARIDIRRIHEAELTAKFQNAFGQEYDYHILQNAEQHADASIHETQGKISNIARKRESTHKQEQHFQKENTRRKDFDVSR